MPLSRKDKIKLLIQSIIMTAMWVTIAWAVSACSGFDFRDVSFVIILFIVSVIAAAVGNDNRRF